MFDIFNSKLNKALDIMEMEIEDYKEKERRCVDMIRKTDMSKIEDLAQMKSWQNYYQHKREALEDLKKKFEQYVF